MGNLESVIFYRLERSIKTYRKFAQKQLNKAGHHITIDQWLILSVLRENSGITQNEIATRVFKDAASVARIIELMVQTGFIKRSVLLKDRRRAEITITIKGENELKAVKKIVKQNRQTALQDINNSELTSLNKLLKKITSNCKG